MSKLKHGMCNTPSYRSWAAMKSRCTNPNRDNYRYYGGRGISYDPKWETFEGFYGDMGERPERLTLDRIDNTKDYSKDNCKWSDIKEQCLNRRSTNKFPGISFNKQRNKYCAYKFINGKKKHLGSTERVEDAKKLLL